MKKTILILILFITTLNLTFAQETQSDATLEETVNWINEIAIPKQLKRTDDFYLTSIYTDIEKKEIRYYRESIKWGELNDYQKFNKHNSITVTYSDDSFLVQIIYETNHLERMDIRYSDKEMARRTYNAFNHLFKLLNIEVKRYNKLANENKF